VVCTEFWIEYNTGILILPQRQTGLVAKQAATLDVSMGSGFAATPSDHLAALCTFAEVIGFVG
jgi:hypothetical protein